MPDTIAKKLILHVGLHKTGTTAIQAGLARHAGFLQHRGYTQAVMHWDLPFLHAAFNPKVYGKIREEIDLQSIRQRFREWAEHQEGETIILSGEAMSLFFWDLRGKNEEVGSSLFTGFADTSVVLYFRRQDTFFESAYNQLVKDGLADSLEEFFQSPGVGLLQCLDWQAKAQHFRSLFPRASILVKLYEWATRGGDIFRDFLSGIGIEEIPERVATTRENTRMDGRSTELLRICNKHRDAEHRRVLSEVLGRGIKTDELDHLRAPRLSTDQRAQILEQYHDSNARLFAEYGLGSLQRWEQINLGEATTRDPETTSDVPAALRWIDRLYAEGTEGE